MRQSRFIFVFFALTAAVAISACGGGGQGFRVAAPDPLEITSSSLPTTQSAQFIDFEIPLEGGCGGPYVVEVISGILPR